MNVGDRLVISCIFYDGQDHCLIHKTLPLAKIYRAAELKAKVNGIVVSKQILNHVQSDF